MVWIVLTDAPTSLARVSEILGLTMVSEKIVVTLCCLQKSARLASC